MEQLTIIGSVGRAEKKKFNDAEFIEFSVAVNQKKKDGSVITNWYNCITRQVKLEPFIFKGKKVYVQGLPSVKAFIRSSGEAGAEITLFANNIELLGSKNDGQQQPASAASNTVRQAVDTIKKDFDAYEVPSDGLPF